MNIFRNLLILPLLLILAGCAGSANWQALHKSGLKAYDSGRLGKSENKLLESNALLFTENPLDQRALPNLGTLGYLYQINGKDAELGNIYQLEWDILAAANMTETTAAADALYKLASHAHKMGDFPKADSLYLRVLELDRKLLGSSHPYIDLDHYKLAAMKYLSGDLLGAESYLLTVLDLRSNNFTDISQVTEVLSTCIAFYEFQGLYAAAEPFYRRSLETFSRYNPDSPEVVDLWLNYSKLLDRLGMSNESGLAKAKSDELMTYYLDNASEQLDLLETIRVRNAVKLAALDRGEMWLPIYPIFDVAPAPVGGMNAIKNNIEYPTKMLRYDVQGTITVESWIDNQGLVRETVVTVGQEVELYDAAMETVRKTRFFPAFHRGRAEKSWVAVPVTFELLIESEGY